MRNYDDIEKAFDLVSEEDWERIFNSLCYGDMEAAIFDDGDVSFRSELSSSNDEAHLVYKIPLKTSYWRDTLIEWGIYDDLKDDVKSDVDEKIKNDFIEEVLKNIEF